MNVLVTGAAGYIGSWLVPQLLAEGHKVTALDTMWFGNGHLPKDNGMLTVVQGDIRSDETLDEVCKGQDAVIHLAALSNNAMCELSPELSYSVNMHCSGRLAASAKQWNVRKFIFASSVAAYGGNIEDAREDDELKPETPYGKQKASAEVNVRINFPNAIILRAASVCGYSMNMAFHLMVNMMVNHGYRNKTITVNGGDQMRCHIHIADLCDVYKELLVSDIEGKTFNVVAQNLSVLQTAKDVQAVMEYGPKIVIAPKTDDRSYSVDGDKLRRMLKWVPKHRINDAVWDLKVRFQANHWPDSLSNKNYYRIRHDLV